MESKLGIIYCLTSPSGKRYIGQTWDLSKRLIYYRYKSSYKSQIKLSRALDKYGIINFSVDILDYCYDQEELNDAECYWIQYYNSTNIGYNICLGGSGATSLSDEIIEKNRNSNFVYEYSIVSQNGKEYIIKDLKKFSKENDLPYQTLLKICSGKKSQYNGWTSNGRTQIKNKKFIIYTDELKDKQSKAKLGIKRSKEVTQKIRDAAKKVIYTYEMREERRINGLKADRKKIGEKLKGREISGETREKIRNKLKGKKPWNTGKRLSEDHKNKVIKTLKSGGFGGHNHSDMARDNIGKNGCKYEYTLVDPTGNVYITKSLNKFCQEHSLILNCILVMLRGKQKQHKGWTATRVKIK